VYQLKAIATGSFLQLMNPWWNNRGPNPSRHHLYEGRLLHKKVCRYGESYAADLTKKNILVFRQEHPAICFGEYLFGRPKIA